VREWLNTPDLRNTHRKVRPVSRAAHALAESDERGGDEVVSVDAQPNSVCELSLGRDEFFVTLKCRPISGKGYHGACQFSQPSKVIVSL
jgi:hypothetical protein